LEQDLRKNGNFSQRISKYLEEIPQDPLFDQENIEGTEMRLPQVFRMQRKQI